MQTDNLLYSDIKQSPSIDTWTLYVCKYHQILNKKCICRYQAFYKAYLYRSPESLITVTIASVTFYYKSVTRVYSGRVSSVFLCSSYQIVDAVAVVVGLFIVVDGGGCSVLSAAANAATAALSNLTI